MSFQVGDWVFWKPKVFGKCPWDMRAYRVAEIENGSLHLLGFTYSVGTWAVGNARKATQEEIDAVPFREGDLIYTTGWGDVGPHTVAKAFCELGNPATGTQWRHATPEEYREHHKEEEPMSNYRELIEALPVGYKVESKSTASECAFTIKCPGRFREKVGHTSGGWWGKGRSGFNTAKALVDSLGWKNTDAFQIPFEKTAPKQILAGVGTASPPTGITFENDVGLYFSEGNKQPVRIDNREDVILKDYHDDAITFWKQKTKDFQEEIARLRKEQGEDYEDINRLQQEISGLNEDVESLTEEIACLTKSNTHPCNPGQIMQDVVTKAGPYVVLDHAKTGAYIHVYRGVAGEPGAAMGSTKVYVEALEPYVAPPSLARRAAPYLVATCVAVLTASAGHWLVLSLTSLLGGL